MHGIDLLPNRFLETVRDAYIFISQTSGDRYLGVQERPEGVVYPLETRVDDILSDVIFEKGFSDPDAIFIIGVGVPEQTYQETQHLFAQVTGKEGFEDHTSLLSFEGEVRLCTMLQRHADGHAILSGFEAVNKALFFLLREYFSGSLTR